MSSVDLPDRVLRKKKELEIDRLFQALVKLAGSDLHLKVDRPPYVRQRAPRKTVEAIDDLANEAGAGGRYAHDSNVAVSGGAFSGGRAYRKARSNKSTMQGGQYGQYLEVPKGRRSLFESRERARRRKSILALGAIVLVLALIVIFIVSLMTR